MARSISFICHIVLLVGLEMIGKHGNETSLSLPWCHGTNKQNLMPRGDRLIAKLSDNVQVYVFEIGISLCSNNYNGNTYMWRWMLACTRTPIAGTTHECENTKRGLIPVIKQTRTSILPSRTNTLAYRMATHESPTILHDRCQASGLTKETKIAVSDTQSETTELTPK